MGLVHAFLMFFFLASQVLALEKRFLDPRRPTKPTAVGDIVELAHSYPITSCICWNTYCMWPTDPVNFTIRVL